MCIIKSNMMPSPPGALEKLSPDLLMSVLDFVPVLDFYNLKLTGNRYVTEVVREFTSRRCRGEFCRAISEEDARRNRLKPGLTRPALEITIERGQSALVRHFLRKYHARPPSNNDGKSDPNQQEHYYETERRAFRAALHWAAYYGSESIVSLLLGPDRINIRSWKPGYTALHVAAARGHVAIVALLLEHGAETDTLDAQGSLPLQLALNNGHDAVVAVLQSRGAASNLEEAIEAHGLRKLLRGRSRVGAGLQSKSPALPSPRRSEDQTFDMRPFLKYQNPNNRPMAGRSEGKERDLMLEAISVDFPPIINSLLNDGFPINATLDSRGYTALHIAAERGSHQCAKLLLERGADQNKSCAVDGIPAFHAATHRRGRDTLRVFLDAGFPVDTVNRKGATALHKAANLGDEAVINVLLAAGADVSEKCCRIGSTPLHHISRAGTPQLVNLLLAAGGSVDSKDANGSRPLHFAGNSQVARALIDRGADVNARNDVGSTPLHTLWDLDTLEELLQSGANVDASDAKGRSRAHLALSDNLHDVYDTSHCDGILDLLVRFGADLEQRDNNGETVLHYALTRNVHMVPRLLTYGVNVNSRDAQGRPPLRLALGAYRYTYGTFKSFLDSGADISWRDEQGRTLIHCAYSGRYPGLDLRILDLMLERGIDFDVSDDAGLTPLFLVAKIGDVEAASRLLEKGARVNITDKQGSTPLHHAFHNSSGPSIGMVMLLLSHGANIEAKDKEGYTALHLAIKGTGNQKLIGFLLAKRANIHAADNKGRTPLHHAILQSYFWYADILGMLMDHGAAVDVKDDDGCSPLELANKMNLQDHVEILRKRR
ncbi:hypothetical protein FQN54_009273 [Arachnomyces sp. PD_36]|nr:hypothetical protein FQN54_009273 [Arachnomyces sp. PD_36]